MKIDEIIKLTGASKPSIYRWMERHPKLDVMDADSLLGHPFPKPIRKDGRVVIWDEIVVQRWWNANASTVGRHSDEKPSAVLPWKRFREVMLQAPETSVDEIGVEQVVNDEMDLIQRFERQGDEVRIWFSSVSDAVKFKLRNF